MVLYFPSAVWFHLVLYSTLLVCHLCCAGHVPLCPAFSVLQRPM